MVYISNTKGIASNPIPTTIVALSDTHNLHEEIEIPAGTILIHAGDATNASTKQELESFIRWMGHQPHQYKIFCPGNHDSACENLHSHSYIKQRFKEANCYMLTNDLIEINGYKIYVNSSFYEYRNAPEKPDVLVTHVPPAGILDWSEPGTKFNKGPEDIHFGSSNLITEIITKIKPKIHIFGHVHSCADSSLFYANTHYYNVASCNDEYKAIFKPRIIEL